MCTLLREGIKKKRNEQISRLYQKEPTSKTEEYFHNTCPACGGHGWYYPESGIPLHSIPCPKCNGTGLGTINKLTLSRVIGIVLILIALGYVICKLLNL